MRIKAIGQGDLAFIGVLKIKKQFELNLIGGKRSSQFPQQEGKHDEDCGQENQSSNRVENGFERKF